MSSDPFGQFCDGIWHHPGAHQSYDASAMNRDYVDLEFRACIAKALSVVEAREEDRWAREYVLGIEDHGTARLLFSGNPHVVTMSCANSWVLADDDYCTLLDTSLFVDMLLGPEHTKGDLIVGAVVARLMPKLGVPNLSVYSTAERWSSSSFSSSETEEPFTELTCRDGGVLNGDLYEYSLGRFACNRANGDLLMIYHGCCLSDTAPADTKMVLFRHHSSTRHERLIIKGATEDLRRSDFAEHVKLCLSFKESRHCVVCGAPPSYDCQCNFPYRHPEDDRDMFGLQTAVTSHVGVYHAGASRARVILALPKNVRELIDERPSTKHAPFIGSYYNDISASTVTRCNQTFLRAPVVSRSRIDVYRSPGPRRLEHKKNARERLISSLSKFAVRYYVQNAGVMKSPLPNSIFDCLRSLSTKYGGDYSLPAGSSFDRVGLENMLRGYCVLGQALETDEFIEALMLPAPEEIQQIAEVEHNDDRETRFLCVDTALPNDAQTSEEVVGSEHAVNCINGFLNAESESCPREADMKKRTKGVVSTDDGSAHQKEDQKQRISRTMLRMQRNRASARRSNLKKRDYIQSLRRSLSEAHQLAGELQDKQTQLVLENGQMRRRLQSKTTASESQPAFIDSSGNCTGYL